jgi:hypothetical protein
MTGKELGDSLITQGLAKDRLIDRSFRRGVISLLALSRLRGAPADQKRNSGKNIKNSNKRIHTNLFSVYLYTELVPFLGWNHASQYPLFSRGVSFWDLQPSMLFAF